MKLEETLSERVQHLEGLKNERSELETRKQAIEDQIKWLETKINGLRFEAEFKNSATAKQERSDAIESAADARQQLRDTISSIEQVQIEIAEQERQVADVQKRIQNRNCVVLRLSALEALLKVYRLREALEKAGDEASQCVKQFEKTNGAIFIDKAGPDRSFRHPFSGANNDLITWANSEIENTRAEIGKLEK